MTHSSLPSEVADPAVRGRLATTVALVRIKIEGLWAEAAKFGIIGLMALVIDLSIFNLLISFGGLADSPLTAKVISVVSATTFAYFGNRYWTYRDRAVTSKTREIILFFILNGVGMLIALGCLWFSHYALGLDSVLADNISANGFGLVLGTMFRFFAYRKWVFTEETSDVSDKEILELSEI